MPLDSYGVLVGTLTGHHRDPPDEQGRWFHVNLEVNAPAGHYRCAVDVDSKQSTTGVQWRVLTVHAAQLPLLTGLPAGFKPLAPAANSGALDIIRHPALRPGARPSRRPPMLIEAINRSNARLLRLIGRPATA